VLPAPNPDVVFAPLEGGAVLLLRSDGTYFGLNTVGARIWEMLTPGLESIDSICSELHRQYKDVDPAVLRSDVSELLVELATLGLVGFPGWSTEAQLTAQ
jgi:hypothetical protein